MAARSILKRSLSFKPTMKTGRFSFFREIVRYPHLDKRLYGVRVGLLTLGHLSGNDPGSSNVMFDESASTIVGLLLTSLPATFTLNSIESTRDIRLYR